MVLNEETYVEYTLKSIYDFFEQILIVEGATRSALNASPDGLSTDRTAEIIQDFPDPEKKIVFRQVGWVPSKRELRNMSLRLADIRPGDCFMIQDYDEIWKPEDYVILDDHFNDEEVLYLFSNFVQVFGDFSQMEDLDAKEQSDPPLTTRTEDTVARARSPERAVRYTAGMQFISHVNVCDVYNRFLYEDPFYKQYRVKDFDIGFWHYGYVHPLDKVVQKRAYYGRQDRQMADQSMLMQEIIDEWHIKYCRTGKNEKIVPIPKDLVHPDIMKNHPYYSKSLREVTDPDNKWTGLSDKEFFRNALTLCFQATINTCPDSVMDSVPPNPT